MYLLHFITSGPQTCYVLSQPDWLATANANGGQRAAGHISILKHSVSEREQRLALATASAKQHIALGLTPQHTRALRPTTPAQACSMLPQQVDTVWHIMWQLIQVRPPYLYNCCICPISSHVCLSAVHEATVCNLTAHCRHTKTVLGQGISTWQPCWLSSLLRFKLNRSVHPQTKQANGSCQICSKRNPAVHCGKHSTQLSCFVLVFI